MGTNHLRANVQFESLDLGNATVMVEKSSAIRNLGFYFDHDFSMKTHVTRICQTMHFHLRNRI